jgi:hypothetical protein
MGQPEQMPMFPDFDGEKSGEKNKLRVVKSENDPKKGLFWKGEYSREAGRGESEDTTFEYKEGKFFIDNKEVSKKTFFESIGPVRDSDEIYNKIKKIEEIN